MSNNNFEIINFFPKAPLEVAREHVKIRFKFVVISNSDSMKLVWGPLEDFPYHANLIDKYCEFKEVPSNWIKKPDLVEIIDSDYEIRGGGWMEVNTELNVVILYSESTAYGKFKSEDIEFDKLLNQYFIDYKIEVN